MTDRKTRAANPTRKQRAAWGAKSEEQKRKERNEYQRKYRRQKRAEERAAKGLKPYTLKDKREHARYMLEKKKEKQQQKQIAKINQERRELGQPLIQVGNYLGAELAKYRDQEEILNYQLKQAEIAAMGKQAGTMETLKRWVLEPGFFVWDVFGAEVDLWQADALYNLQVSDRITVKSGHGVGKTTWLVWAAIRHAMIHEPSWKVAVTAPTFTQLRDVFWSTLMEWYRKMDGRYQALFEVTTEQMRLAQAPENFIVRRASSKERPDAFQGFHAKHMLFIADEASGVPEIIFQVAQGAMSTLGAKTLLAGNPVRTQGYFYDSHQPKATQRWAQMTVSSLDSRWVSKDYAQEIGEKYGFESNVYRIRVLGQFPLEEDDVVISIADVENAIHRDPLEERLYNFVWGVDIARYGNDRSALCKRAGNVIYEPVIVWRGKDIHESASRIRHEYISTPDNEKPTEILVDSIGYGAGVVDILFNWGLPARGINVAETQSGAHQGNQRLYNRLRDELWFRCRDWFRTRSPSLCDDVDLVGELTMTHYSYTPSGEIKVESKEDYRKAAANAGLEFHSPDMAEALVLTFAAGLEFPIGSEFHAHDARRTLWNKNRRRGYNTWGRGSWMAK